MWEAYHDTGILMLISFVVGIFTPSILEAFLYGIFNLIDKVFGKEN